MGLNVKIVRKIEKSDKNLHARVKASAPVENASPCISNIMNLMIKFA